MRSHVLKKVCLVLCMAAAAACGGVDPEQVGQDEQGAPPAAEAASKDNSAMLLPDGCGNFKQRCCSNYVCYNSLECDLATGTCLY